MAPMQSRQQKTEESKLSICHDQSSPGKGTVFKFKQAPETSPWKRVADSNNSISVSWGDYWASVSAIQTLSRHHCLGGVSRRNIHEDVEDVDGAPDSIKYDYRCCGHGQANVRNLFPDNLVRAAFQSSGTVYTQKATSQENMDGNETVPYTIGANVSTNVTHEMETHEKHENSLTWVGKLAYKPGVNTIGLLVYCCVFGAILGKIGKSGKVLLKFFNGITIITMNMVSKAMLYSPIGILTLIAGKILGVKDLAGTAQHLGMYMVTGLIGLFIHAVIVIPLIYYILTRKNPFRVTLGILQALITAIGTDSSSATLPVTIRCCEEKLKIDKTITRFMLPIGATINMDGAALFQVITPVYLAQLSKINLDFTQMLTLGLAATLASIGAAGIPGTGLIITMMVMSSVGLPINDLFMILAVDWCLGRMRTMTNVSGDCMAASILQHLFQPGAGRDEPNKNDGNGAVPEDAAKMIEDHDVV
ncbi:excitatory amino acid transporter 1-like isoform X3 [Haliotis rufescens]|uniref:excitatory amino acid transporter 1-like isoform X3 n=1 Tax=Haliotis rufescens TaxID=6454 RepID=UPI00201F7AFE|nr:excitatory amino acid transporter 1-like isoform X3 [Haliotis rufescens]